MASSTGVLIVALMLGTAAAMAETDPALVTAGQKLYAAKKCDVCHMMHGTGGKLAGDLSRVGAKRDSEWLIRFLKNPKAVLSKAKMMPFKGGEEELEALVAYLGSLK